MELFRKAIAVVTAGLLAVTFVAAGFAACLLPPVTHVLSSVFASDQISPFDRNQLVRVADATRDYSFGGHDELQLYQAIYAVDVEYRDALAQTGGAEPAGFPALGAVRDEGNVVQYRAAFAHASEMYCYSEATVSHLDDCYVLAGAATPSLAAVALLAVAGAVFTAATGSKRRLGSVLLGAGGAVLVAFVVLGGWAAVSFDSFFAAFHGVFFSQGNWTFPYDSLLICSLPQPLWAGMGALWLCVAVALAAASLAVARRLRR